MVSVRLVAQVTGSLARSFKLFFTVPHCRGSPIAMISQLDWRSIFTVPVLSCNLLATVSPLTVAAWILWGFGWWTTLPCRGTVRWRIPTYSCSTGFVYSYAVRSSSSWIMSLSLRTVSAWGFAGRVLAAYRLCITVLLRLLSCVWATFIRHMACGCRRFNVVNILAQRWCYFLLIFLFIVATMPICAMVTWSMLIQMWVVMGSFLFLSIRWGCMICSGASCMTRTSWTHMVVLLVGVASICHRWIRMLHVCRSVWTASRSVRMRVFMTTVTGILMIYVMMPVSAIVLVARSIRWRSMVALSLPVPMLATSCAWWTFLHFASRQFLQILNATFKSFNRLLFCLHYWLTCLIPMTSSRTCAAGHWEMARYSGMWIASTRMSSPTNCNSGCRCGILLLGYRIRPLRVNSTCIRLRWVCGASMAVMTTVVVLLMLIVVSCHH